MIRASTGCSPERGFTRQGSSRGAHACKDHRWALLCGVFVSAGCAAAVEFSARPNIVFILADDLRYDALGCAGNAWIRTPHMDRLAARGVRFDRAFVTLSICSPSRAAFLTGLYGRVNGVTTLGQPLREGTATLPQLLKAAGYRTALFGKWHLGTSPESCGFEEVVAFEANGPYYNRRVRSGPRVQTVPGHVDEYICAEAVQFMERAREGPFFVWICTQAPHMNERYDWDARDETLALYDPERIPLPTSWQDDLSGKPPYLLCSRHRVRAREMYGYCRPDAIQTHWRRYGAAVTELDASIGLILRAVDRPPLRTNTWVVLSSDNGWLMGEHGMTSKVLAYEESIRIPLIVVGPTTTARVDRHLVLNVDVPPTILELAAVPVPASWHGRSLVPLLRDDRTAWRSSILYDAPTSALGSRPLAAVRDERWKYIRTWMDPTATDFYEELYDLEADPAELVNRARDPLAADVLRRLRSELDCQLQALKEPAR